MKLFFLNSLTRKKEEFVSIDDVVRIYSCGPTVYNFPHIGNFRSFLFSDLLHRVLLYAGYKVKLVMNLTDVDDKTILNSQKNKVSLDDYTKQYIKGFFDSLNALNVMPASEYPRATAHVSEMIEIIKKLKDNGLTYESDGSIYFKISSFPDYGKLSNLKQEDLLAGAGNRVSSDEYEKAQASDFVLWKRYQESDGDVYWDSPFGKGRPGWHIECSAMSSRYLGNHFDIHTGGVDNKFPHHENEIAQSEGANKEKFVNYWLHCEHLLVDNKKMSKSLDNFYTLDDLAKLNLSYESIRYLLLSSHYRKQLNFTIDGVKGAESSILRVNNFIQELYTYEGVSKVTTDNNYSDLLANKIRQFNSALADDLNVSGALGSLFEIINYYNKLKNENISLSEKEISDTISFFIKINTIFSVFNTEKKEHSFPEEIKSLLSERKQARADKNFKRSDEIRDIFLEMGYSVKDSSEGQVLTANE